MPQIHAARRARAREMVRALGAGAVLVTARPNVRYLTGLASSNAALLLPADGAGLLATDSRYALAAQRDAPDLELLIERFIEGKLATEAARRGVTVLAFEAQEMTVERHAAMTRDAGVTTVPFGKIKSCSERKRPALRTRRARDGAGRRLLIDMRGRRTGRNGQDDPEGERQCDRNEQRRGGAGCPPAPGAASSFARPVAEAPLDQRHAAHLRSARCLSRQTNAVMQRLSTG